MKEKRSSKLITINTNLPHFKSGDKKGVNVKSKYIQASDKKMNGPVLIHQKSFKDVDESVKKPVLCINSPDMDFVPELSSAREIALYTSKDLKKPEESKPQSINLSMSQGSLN